MKFLLNVDEFIPTSERSKVIVKTANDLWNIQVEFSLSDKMPKASPLRSSPGPYCIVTEDGLVDQENI